MSLLTIYFYLFISIKLNLFIYKNDTEKVSESYW